MLALKARKVATQSHPSSCSVTIKLAIVHQEICLSPVQQTIQNFLKLQHRQL